MRKVIRLLAILSLLVSGLTLAPAVVDAGPKPCGKNANNTPAKLMECVTLSGVRAHQQALQAIANENGGTRAAGTPGYDASVDYVVGQLQAAGYIVTIHEFPFVFVPPVLLQQLTPVSATYESGGFTGTGFGDVTASVTPIDINLVPPRATTSGCEAADFAGFPVGNIALIQRGSCNFSVKAQNAQAAGASAVIIFNQGDTSLREGLIVGTLLPFNATIPVVGASFADGVALAQPGSTARVDVDPPQNITQQNVLAETTTGDPNNVIMAGAHLDSVQAGPGINDNGSGSAAILEVALQMKKVKPVNKVRFAWWGAEESGLVGSTAYVNGLSAEEQAKIELYLNFDMIGSPNYGLFVYDGDDSDATGAPAGPPGSAEIEEVFEEFYAARGELFEGTDFTGRSDYGPFIAVGIPAGGLFTGAEGVKTVAQVEKWGGVSGQQYDPCYHLACDTFSNNSNTALNLNSDSVANAVILYSMALEVLPAPPAP